MKEAAQSEVKGDNKDASKKPKVLKYGLNHITTLIEKKKVSLVVLAHDVDPIELVVWIPALCRKMDIPYCIVKGKARLGHLVHKKTATAVVLQDVRTRRLCKHRHADPQKNTALQYSPTSFRRVFLSARKI